MSVRNIPFDQVKITGGFWAQKQRMNRETTVFSVERRFRDTGRFQAFKLTWKPDGEEPQPHFFWDSDIAKWVESVAYILKTEKDEALYRSAREVIDDLIAGQCEDGYFNIYHQIVHPEERFKDRDHHELYCLGHLIEAALAWRQATGEEDFLQALDRYIDLVIRVFTVERSAAFVTPGHEEIELALLKLYEARPDPKYLSLAMFFLDERGKADPVLGNWARGMYNQSHLPVREQATAEGHSVRAGYLYTAMAHAARLTGDETLLSACKKIFDDIVCHKMYLTGGVGSSCHGEAYTIPYDLPNDVAYAETCAAISLAFFAARMQEIEPEAKYADAIERVLYNGMLSGISLDGKSFFYENPLEIRLADRRRNVSVTGGDRLPITQRLEVFGCSCCPPNVTRVLASLGGWAFSADESRVFLHQYMPCTASFDGVRVTVETAYPAEGKIAVHIKGAKGRTLYLRIPGWCRAHTLEGETEVVNGYAAVPVTEDEQTFVLTLEMEPVFVSANPAVSADAGKVALTFGPLVYCAEGVDNDVSLPAFRINVRGSITEAFAPEYSAPVFTVAGFVPAPSDALYAPAAPEREDLIEKNLKMIPYFAFANRGESDMAVWFLRGFGV